MKLIAFLTLHSHISISIQQKCRGSAVCWSLMIPPTLHTPHRASLSLFFSRRPAAARWRPAGPGLQTFLPHLQSHFVTSTSSHSSQPIPQSQQCPPLHQHSSTPVHQSQAILFARFTRTIHLFSKTNKEATISHLILGKFIHFLHFMWKRAFSCFTLYLILEVTID